MVRDVDDKFFERADAHIHLANDQLKEISRGKVSASMLYSVARFNTWNSACGYESSEEMAADRQGILDYYVTEYRKMLEENIDDYVENFAKYMAAPDETA